MTEDEKEHRSRSGIIKVLIIVFSAILVILLFFFGIRFLREREVDSNETFSLKDEDEQDNYDEYSGVYSASGVDVVMNENREETAEPKDSSEFKEIYLTFDDGPSIYTDDILDILDKYQVKATFFVVYKEGETAASLYQRIVDEGHTLAMHSYSHKYSEVYESVDSFSNDIKSLQEYLYETTGVWSRIYRFPGGSSNQKAGGKIDDYISYLNDEGITYFDWNVSAQDAVSGYSLSENTIFENCIKGVDRMNECVVLMHDSGDRRSTVDALDEIIEYYQARKDCRLLPITDSTAPVQHRRSSEDK